MRRFSRFLVTVVAALALAGVGAASQGSGAKGGATKAAAGPVIVLETVKGTVEIETLPSDAPKSVAHIVELVKQGASIAGCACIGCSRASCRWAIPRRATCPSRIQWGAAATARRSASRSSRSGRSSAGRSGSPIAKTRRRSPPAASSSSSRAPNPQLNGKYTAIGRVSSGNWRRRETSGRRHDQIGEREMTRRRTISVDRLGWQPSSRLVCTWGVVGAREAQSAQAALAEPFKGLTTNGTVQPGLFPIRTSGVSTRPVRDAATRFLACAHRRTARLDELSRGR